MSGYLGIDIGAVSATACLLVHGDEAAAPAEWREVPLASDAPVSGRCYLSPYRRTRGRPLEVARALIDEVRGLAGESPTVCLTGGGSRLAADRLSASEVNEFRAIASGVAALGIRAATVFEMGGETSKYLRLSRNEDGSESIVDYATNGDCAAGTGSFIDQQCGRLNYRVEDVGDICLSAERSAQVAGRCSVFAKSDMIHAQQKGFSPAEVLRGLCDAVARNFRAAVVRSHAVEAPVVLLGGVASNAAVVQAMREAFELDETQLAVPEHFAHVPAVGAAVAATRVEPAAGAGVGAGAESPSDVEAADGFPRQSPLSLERCVLLRDRVQAYQPPFGADRIDAYLGIDIGSVSTNLVVVDVEGRVIAEIYTRTQGRPIEVVSEGLKAIQRDWGHRVVIRGAGTTGSGRELVGALIGADTINDEITCHKTGATFIGQTLLDGRVPDTIFEIGGQDSKYISLQDGVVVDFTMNEACAAGTGSFLEERAEELGISIKGEFAELALSSDAPIRLGERCTVFMERDVNSYVQRGASTADLVAGLSYSVVYNYINRVVRGRPIGECVFFQGGTAYNDATVAAFAMVTGKEVIVPPHNGVIGAIGAALLARDKVNASDELSEQLSQPREARELGEYVSTLDRQSPPARAASPRTSFRGFDLAAVDYSLREFTCKGCSNACQIQEFTVEGEKTYWGDKCSDRFRKRAKASSKPVIDDLISLRRELLLDESGLPEVPDDAPTVGIPMTMFAWAQLPLWRTLMAGLGFRTVLSDQTNKRIVQSGLDTVVAEPCFPIIAAHGHIMDLIAKEVDAILVPNILSMATHWKHTESHLCPWHQTLPFVTRQAPAIKPHAGRFLTPLVRFREGRASATRELVSYFRQADGGNPQRLGRRAMARAVQAAFEAQDAFDARIRQAGDDAMRTLRQTGERAIVLVGRPYNLHDDGICLSVGRKLRDYYGVNVVPMDFLDLDEVDVRDINGRMYWNLGRDILAASKVVGRHENLHIIYVTNFKCGPDSFIKHFVRSASGKPFLSLQFDGHGNDAGMMTRCEAYLDSKGFLRPWRPSSADAAAGTPAD